MRGVGRLHAVLVDDDPLARVCRELPESACREEPRNYSVHVVSLSLTKVGEGLADPKLVLAWLDSPAACSLPSVSHKAESIRAGLAALALHHQRDNRRFVHDTLTTLRANLGFGSTAFRHAGGIKC